MKITKKKIKKTSYSNNTIKTVTATVEITVSDVNDNTPQFDKSKTLITIFTNLPLNTLYSQPFVSRTSVGPTFMVQSLANH